MIKIPQGFQKVPIYLKNFQGKISFEKVKVFLRVILNLEFNVDLDFDLGFELFVIFKGFKQPFSNEPLFLTPAIKRVGFFLQDI